MHHSALTFYTYIFTLSLHNPLRQHVATAAAAAETENRAHTKMKLVYNNNNNGVLLYTPLSTKIIIQRDQSS